MKETTKKWKPYGSAFHDEFGCVHFDCGCIQAQDGWEARCSAHKQQADGWKDEEADVNDQCPVCGFYCTGNGGMGCIHKNASISTIRKFASGATRDTDEGKPDYEGFISPLVTKRYGQYMHTKRIQADGAVRSGDNWQKGLSKESYIKSLTRHVEDFKLHHDGIGDEAIESLEDSLCAIIFNASGYLFELLKEKRVKDGKTLPQTSE